MAQTLDFTDPEFHRPLSRADTSARYVGMQGLSRRFARRLRKLQQLRLLARWEPLRRLAKASRNIEFDYLCHYILRNTYLLHTRNKARCMPKRYLEVSSYLRRWSPESRQKLLVPDSGPEGCNDAVIRLLAGDVHLLACDANDVQKCKPPRLICTQTCPTPKMQFSRCRKFYQSGCRRFIGVPCEFWGMQRTPRTPCRRPSSRLTDISTNSGDRRRWLLG